MPHRALEPRTSRPQAEWYLLLTRLSLALDSCDSPLPNLTHGLGCVSAAYGSDTCGAWDQSMPSCQGANPPLHCAQQWCYVDAALCRSSSLRCD